MDVMGNRLGRRVLVDGLAGSGKSTFSHALSVRMGLPLIYLDLHYWQPGWVRPSEREWREKQRRLLAGDAWIADGNYLETLDLRLERADTVVLLDTPWWICAGRAFVRGFRKPGELPEGCGYPALQRLRDGCRMAGVACRDRGSYPEQVRTIVSQHGQHARLYVLPSTQAVREFLNRL
jgi:adenylate kinase family enzyme